MDTKRIFFVVLSAAVVVLAMSGTAAPTQRQPSTRVALENGRPGDTRWQLPLPRPERAIEGYATEASVAPGGTLHFHVSTAPAARYRIEISRLGWYGGLGGRLEVCLPSCQGDEPGLPRARPRAPLVGPTAQPLRAGWPTTDNLVVPASWLSGYFIVRFVLTSGPDAGSAAETFVVVRQPPTASPSQILVQVPTNTWQAYNQWGGKSLYDFGGRRAYRVSFERPYGAMAQSPLWWELQLVRFLEREGYDVSYQADVDTDRDQASLLRHRLIVVAGHDEYWSKGMRDAFDAALSHGTNLAFMGSNDAYWQVRYEDGAQTLFSYKSMYDPSPVVALKTAMFREVGRPECALTGVQHQYIRPLAAQLDYAVTPAGAADPWLAGTGLKAGDRIVGVVGREHDVLNPWPDSCFHPGLTVLFHYQGSPADQNADAVRYTAPSGARVFASGAQRFSWALDPWRSEGAGGAPELPLGAGTGHGVPADPRIQRFMRNALDDLTRPAPPSGLAVSRNGDRLRVSITKPVDPRYSRFVAAVEVRRRWRRICVGVTVCTGRAPHARGQMQLGVLAIDSWRRRSVPAFRRLR